MDNGTCVNGYIDIHPNLFDIHVQAPIFGEEVIKTDLEGGIQLFIIVIDGSDSSAILLSLAL